MDEILKIYTKAEIARICKVCGKTVYNWFDNSTLPFWALDKLGFGVYYKKGG